MTGARVPALAVLLAAVGGASAFSLPGVALKGLEGRGAATGRILRVRGGSPNAPSMQMGAGGMFGFGKKDDQEEAGKFVRQGRLDGLGQKAFGPMGLVVGGFGEDELEVLAETVDGFLWTELCGPPPVVPIAVLTKEDLAQETTLSSVLTELKERDGVLPDAQPDLKTPLVLFSGFLPLQVSGLSKAIVGSGIRGGMPGKEVPPMCAIAVPNAMDKTLLQLCDEIEGDHLANAPGTQQP